MDDDSQEANIIKRKGRTLLTDKSTRPGIRPGGVQGQTLDKIPEKSFKKKKTIATVEVN